MTHENGKKYGGGAEHAEEQAVAELLGGLKRVEAPKDFDFHLKARIANARPNDLRPASLFPILKYALPLALFLFVGAGLVLNGSYQRWQEPYVAEVPSDSQSAAAPVTVSTPMVNPIVASTQPSPAATPDLGEKPRLAIGPKRPQSAGMSNSSNSQPSGRPGGSALFTGGNSNQNERLPRNMDRKPLGAQEALRLLGVEADFENGSWTVKAVKANEAAGQLGVKAGDRLRAIDNKPIGEKTEFEGGGIKVSTIRVQRGNDTIDLAGTVKPE